MISGRHISAARNVASRSRFVSMRRSRPWLVFALIFAWKVALFVSSSQPIPANDAFFYDGAAIHKMLYGGFYNPAISMAFPISGHKLFSGYPPLYQFPLLA